MDIKRTDVILEIGSGDNPHPRADILCDRYITTSHERAGGFRIRIDRPMVVADGMRLPFADKTFDYVIASHIFEHMDDPAGFAREIMRVGKAGYIEVPSALSERVFGWKFHHWYCELHDGVLVFTPKKEGEQHGGFFHRFIAQNLWFRRFFEEHEAQWYTRLEWKRTIPLRVQMRPVSGDEIDGLDEKAWALLKKAKPEQWKDMVFAIRFFFRRVARKIRKTVRQHLWNANQTTDWMRLLVCPKCRRALHVSRGEFVCGSCKSSYPVDGGIPILLVEEEIQKGH